MTGRIICQFSCGAASAVATKLAIAQYSSTHDVRIINAFLKEEHHDNRRFAADCAQWFGREITTLRDDKYGASVIQVFRRRQYMKGPMGAPCSRELKRKVLDAWKQPGDIMVFGYTIEEVDRLDDFREMNPDRPVIAPLIDAGLSKGDCKAMVERAGIILPVMYLMGYDNANCIGCVKGGEGYWRAIREDFPEYFEAICLLQDEIGEGSWFLRYRSGPLKDQRFPLRDLPAGEARRNEALPSCSFFCELAGRSANTHGYRHEMTDDDHRHMADVLRAAHGMVVLSGYATPLYDNELFSDWERYERRHMADGGLFR